jgi:hypothetical protein
MAAGLEAALKYNAQNLSQVCPAPDDVRDAKTTQRDRSIRSLCPDSRLGPQRLRNSKRLPKPGSKPISDIDIAPRFSDSPGYSHANTGASYSGGEPFPQPDANNDSYP